MAICTEHLTIGERELIRTYSDAGKYVVRDGVSYEEAIDPAQSGRVYTEGDTIPPEETGREAEEILNILVGEEE